jgi:hypothetical protein
MKTLQPIYLRIFTFLISIAFVACTLNQFAKLIQHLLKIKYDWRFEMAMVMGMFFFQLPFILQKTWSVKWNYYFNMLLVSVKGALLLWPFLIFNHFFRCSDWMNLSYFLGVVLIMFFDHKKRVAQMHFPVFISYTWVLYRLIILIFIIK